MSMKIVILLSVFVIFITSATGKVTEDNCEVCVKYLRRFIDGVPEEDRSDMGKLEKHFKDACKKAKGRDERLCYYIGGLKTSATYIVNELTKPMSWGMPMEKVCEKLKVVDPQICDLKYEKIVDLTKVNLKKLKVKDLRKILDAWGEQCRGCTEKSEFIKLIEEKMPVYAPEAAKARAAKQEL